VTSEQRWWHPNISLGVEELTMTATALRPLSDSSDALLRFALRVDATLCAGTGLLIAMAADPLSRLTGLSSVSEWIAGAAVVGYGAGLYVLAAVPRIRRIGVGVVVANVVFAVVAVTLLVLGALPLTGAGVAMVLVMIVATLGCAAAQYFGVRRLA
jgi:hypothetical protein